MKLPLALGAGVIASFLSRASAANEVPCLLVGPRIAECYAVDSAPSWIFRRGTYTHDPYTGARVAQYMRTPPVEPLDDERMVTSRYNRKRTVVRGADGSVDTYYEVQQWGNGRGGLDAEWERFHDAWKESYISGGYYNQSPAYGAGGYGGGYGAGFPAYGFPGYGYPGYGFPPGYHGGGPPHGDWRGHSGGPHGGRHHGGAHHGRGPHAD